MEQIDAQRPKGSVSLAAAIDSLREELVRSMWNSQTPFTDGGRDYLLQFKPTAVELTLQADFTASGGGEAGINWWLIKASANGSVESKNSQTIKLTLNPVLLDVETGAEHEVAIDGSDTSDYDLTEYH